MTALRHRWRLLGGVVVTAAVALGPSTDAWATFRATRVGATSVSAHAMDTPAKPACSGLGVGSVTLTWPAPADAGQADVYGSGFLAATYEVGKSSSSTGPFTYTGNGTSTSYTTTTLLSGDTYFVVRTAKYSWRSAPSPARLVRVAVLGLLASCP